MSRQFLLIPNLLLAILTVVVAVQKQHRQEIPQPQTYAQPIQPVRPVPPTPTEKKPAIRLPVPEKQLSYTEIIQLLSEWHQEAPDQTELLSIGRSRKGTDIQCLRIKVKDNPRSQPKVLIFASLHGNEKLGSMVAMGCIGNLLKSYMENAEATEIIRSRDIYFIPVLSVDSFNSNQRQDEGVDPNRSWSDRSNQEHQGTACVELVKSLHRQIHFDAALSIHNYGRVYLHPWGYTTQHTPNHDDYNRILGEMARASGYQTQQLYRQSAPPYYGYEVDWLYKNGAFALVIEIGKRFEAAPQEIQYEVQANYPAFVIFLKEGPKVSVGGRCPAIDSWR